MSEMKKPAACPDCELSRRQFLKTAGVAAVAAAAAPVFATARVGAAPAAGSQDTLVSQLYGTLNNAQKSAVCFGWDHPRRQMIANNWMIVPQTIGKFYTPDQQELITAIFKSAHSEEWVSQRLKQMTDDSGPEGLKAYSIAMFGTPGSGKFEWVLTGRHLTLRVDGDSEPGVAFGGPIFYGHAAQGFDEKADHPGNVYWYQALRANEVFKALDGKQREKALQTGDIPGESPQVLVSRAAEQRAGLPVAQMTRDQRELVEKVLADLLAPMSPKDQSEARRYLQANGGVESLHMAFYKQGDIGNDGVWDVWRLEGPAMSWYFRGEPHVHTWAWLGEKPLATAPPGP
ncbi:MAG: DUF3500 domain-containing protein [Armatimonadota bacterium]